MSTHTERIDKVSERVRDMLSEIEEDVVLNYTLADAIREGASVSGQARDWTDSDGNVCALSAATAALNARRSL